MTFTWQQSIRIGQSIAEGATERGERTTTKKRTWLENHLIYLGCEKSRRKNQQTGPRQRQRRRRRKATSANEVKSKLKAKPKLRQRRRGRRRNPFGCQLCLPCPLFAYLRARPVNPKRHTHTHAHLLKARLGLGQDIRTNQQTMTTAYFTYEPGQDRSRGKGWGGGPVNYCKSLKPTTRREQPPSEQGKAM